MDIRQAVPDDASRIAEIQVFSKRLNYRRIFHDDDYSFGVLQVVPLAESYLADEDIWRHMWVYDDRFVKGVVRVRDGEVESLYVDPFFTGEGIGARLLEFAVDELSADNLWALEKNTRALSFYRRHAFIPDGSRRFEEGTVEYLIHLVRR